MHIRSEMHRAVTVHGVPSCGIGCAVKLGIQSDAHNGIFRWKTDHACGRVPACTAGRAPQHPQPGNLSLLNTDLKFRRTEMLSVMSQADLPGKSASGGRCNDAGDVMFFA